MSVFYYPEEPLPETRINIAVPRVRVMEAISRIISNFHQMI